MMSHYSELTIIPQPNIPPNDILAFVMQTLHRFLPAYQGRIGIGFPEYGKRHSLGNCIRLFGNLVDVTHLVAQLKNSPASHYAQISTVTAVPQDKIYAHLCFKRYHNKGLSDIRRAEKRLKEQGLDSTKLLPILANKILKLQPSKLPHIRLKSASSRQQFVLIIQRFVHNEAVTGEFNAYGLSKGATIPAF